MTVSFEGLKGVQHRTWTSGDYANVARLTVPLAQELVEAVDPAPGTRVLDVACGTGHVALAAARRFCEVTGVDYVPALVERARERAHAERLHADFEVGDAEALPYPDGSFDTVLSSIGVMFVADHQQGADELVRVTRPGGSIGVASWTPDGFVGRLLRVVSGHVPPPAGAQPPTRWGAPGVAAEMFGDRVEDVEERVLTVRERFHSPEHFADLFLHDYGPTHQAALTLDTDAREAFRQDLVDLAASSDVADDGTLATEWDYLLVTARRR
ncbi:class I SAM-dependent methyltransferase [Nocardioides marmoribigeumensis]|uniref:SAM-dependent methyltransferase n=1 Tax=Nocardioides marmoribigeumensis TaxID=433649 RepID=A0ABU2BYE8_9ACTN|nr:class I SAM-dependent methyltransferase [Nocardioides marmoribigeumensis]MDR7363426.1 SAM-dependent methyltransferase [Nocardioides marmoribigeumensis]